ncbi:MAG: transketolase C-terminal domain-containing protein, partial [Nitrospiria bacterium]
KGYAPAESDPAAYHGTPAFDLSTGQAKKKAGKSPPSYTSVFSKTLVRLAEKDKNIVAITAAMPAGTGLNAFQKAFPTRFYDVGISEQHAVTMAAGMAADGLKPVVAIYSTFLQRGFDQIVHDVALQNLPVVFCMDRAGLVGEDGPTHAGVFDIAYLKGIPNMMLMAPKDENELQHMLATALQQQQPVAIRYPRGAGAGIPLDENITPLPTGKGEIVMGDEEAAWDTALVAIGNMVYPAQAASLELKEQGITAGVVNARFAKPLDRELIISVARRAKKVVTLEEHVLSGGFGESVLSVLEAERNAGNMTPVTVHRIGLPDAFTEHGNQKRLQADLGLDVEGISKAVAEFMALPAQKIRLASQSDVAKSSRVKVI